MSPSIRTMGFFMSEINFCNTKEQLNHLGEVVTGKVDGSPSGADIDTSTLPYTGQVRKTLPALEGEYETSIATKQAEADAAIDEYRLLNKGPYTSGITLESKFEYITYNGESYFATNPPYTTTSTTPDADGNLFAGDYSTKQYVKDITNYQASSVSDLASGLTSGGIAVSHSVGSYWYVTSDVAPIAIYRITNSPTNIPVIGGLYAEVMPIGCAADVESFSAAKAGTHRQYSKIVTRGHTVEGRGSAVYVRTGGSGVVSSGDEIKFYDALGYEWALDENQRFDIEMFGGLHDAYDNSEAFIKAANYLKASDTQAFDRPLQSNELWIPKRETPFSVPPYADRLVDELALTEPMSHIILVGYGDVEGIYRHTVARPTSRTSREFSGVVPYQLPIFTAASNPVVVVVGDSISALTNNNLGLTNTYYNSIVQRIQSSRSGVTFYNRAIGGLQAQHFAGITAMPGIPLPPWWDDEAGTKDWMDQVKDLNPDLVIVSFGMNDTVGLRFSHLVEIRRRLIGAGGIDCDVVWGTCTVPHRGAKYDNGSGLNVFAPYYWQEGRDQAAGCVRTYANYVKDGIIDLNRQTNIIRDGRDIVDNYLVEHNDAIFSNGQLTYTEKGTDFSVELVIDCANISDNSVFLYFQMGPEVDNIGWLSTDASRNLKYVVQSESGYAPRSGTTSVTLPSTGFLTFRIYKASGTLIVQVGDDQNEPQVYDTRVPTLGGDFTPKFGDNGFQSGVIESYVARIGVPTRFKPSLIDNDIFGVSELGNNVTKSPAGGQGLNHFTSIGITSIVNPVLDNCHFC